VPSSTGLFVTSKEIATQVSVVRVYPIADLVKVQAREGETVEDYASLIDLVTVHLSPNSWTDSGGPGSISAWRGCLVVDHTLEQHRSVSLLLSALRQLKNKVAEEKPDKAIGTISLMDTAAIKQRLAKRDSATLDTELRWYVEDLRKTLGVPVEVDSFGLDEAGVTPQCKIQLSHRDIAIGDVVRETLASKDLAAVIHEDYIDITSVGKAQRADLQTRIYPVHDLVSPEEAKEAKAEPWLGMVVDDPLVDIITSSIEAALWTDNGGPYSISRWQQPPAIVVTANEKVHAGVDRLLTDVRAAQPKRLPQEDERIIERTYRLYVDRRALKAKLPERVKEAKKEDKQSALSMPRDLQAQFAGFIGLPPHSTLAGPKVAEPIPTADDVAKLVRELLPDDSWEEEGVLLRPFHDVLIIRQRRPMLRKIEKLLIDIDAWQPPARYALAH
jgi:hypothetical protein